jgi:enoyl-CoA hydratase/carnithine racemase
VITELDAVLGIIEGDQPKGLVIRSTKPSGFIVGADINEFRGATAVLSLAMQFARERQRFLDPALAITGRTQSRRSLAPARRAGIARGFFLKTAYRLRRREPGSGRRRGSSCRLRHAVLVTAAAHH